MAAFRSLFLIASFLLGCLCSAPAQPVTVLPVVDFATTESARAVWRPASGVAEVELADDGIRFPCNFTAVASRCSWDASFPPLDLTNRFAFRMRIHVEDPAPVSSLTIYLRSGSGWFYKTFSSLSRGWQELSADLGSFGVSGTPSGWHTIDGVRFSPWRASGLSKDTVITLGAMELYTPSVLVVRGTFSTAQDTANSTADLIAGCLTSAGIEFGETTEEKVEIGALDGVSLAIFPYSNNMSPAEVTRVESFVASGGRIIQFFTAPPSIFALLGLSNQGSAGVAPRAMQFRGDLVACLPPLVEQASWNFFKVAPTGPGTQVLATWLDGDGNSLGHPAWTLSENGAYMSHVLLGDDVDNKTQMLQALVIHFVPAAGDAIIQKRLAESQVVGVYRTFPEATDGIEQSAELHPRRTAILAELTSATLLREAALAESRFCETRELLDGSQAHLREAYYLVQRPLMPEFRASWASYNNSSGPFVEGWDKLANDLSSNGFHAVFPYMGTGGVAHYDSKLLPHSDVVDLRGDHIAACIAACKPRGIETHVRKLNWFMLGAPQSYIDDMRAQERTQVDVYGEDVDWLCPSHPLNFELERAVMLEIIDNYDVDGIHYDFIRYPDGSCCYCNGCRTRFQADRGITVANWPTDCFSGTLKETYREWRRDQITRLVRAMREAVDERGRPVKISAAVFQNYPDCRTSVAQDWVAWIESGYLDFVCPMDYTMSLENFTGLVQSQKAYVAGRVPIYPGIGVSSAATGLSADGAIAQILVTRREQTGGFVLFNYGDYAVETILPNLRKGLTAEPGRDGFVMY